MISVYISIVLFCFQWLFKSCISNLLWTDFSITLPITSRITFSEVSYATCTRINAVGTKVQFAFAVPVSGLIPDLKRSDGSFPQASCQLSLVSPVNRELKRRVPVECSNRSKVEKLSVTAVMQLCAIELYIQWTYIDDFRDYASQFELIAWSVWLIHFATAKLLFRYYDKKPWETFF